MLPLHHFQRKTGTDHDDALTDLLTDLMHWCDRNNFTFEDELSRARMHYEAETDERLLIDVDEVAAS